MTERIKSVLKWSDQAMFKAEDIKPEYGPEVFLLSCNNDPLGSIAAAAKAYKGEFVSTLADVTDDERIHYLEEIQKTTLKMPLEAVLMHFRFKGVTRGFTHQLVRQRTAAYSQESTRFAVKDTVPVGLPPSLAGTTGEMQAAYDRICFELKVDSLYSGMNNSVSLADGLKSNRGFIKWTDECDRMSQEEKWRGVWDKTVSHIERTYNHLVDSGMPAEDARGLLPTNLLTQVNYFTHLRGLQEHSGLRLCTQAQFEWKQVWLGILKAIEHYGRGVTYEVNVPSSKAHDRMVFPQGKSALYECSSEWQFKALSKVFRPICYYTGKCEFGAEFDRKCAIRERVEANHDIGRPSKEWGTGTQDRIQPNGDVFMGIPAIAPIEWMSNGAAR